MLTREEVNFITSRLEGWIQSGLEKLNGSDAVPGKDSQAITELHLELTHRCDLKCIMCHHWEMPVRDPSSVNREMRLKDIQKIVTESRLLKNVKIVVITGGEPLLREDTPEIAAFLREYYPNASIGILTNLWNTELIRQRLADIRSRGVDNLWLGSSLDGVGRPHDIIHARKGAFEGLICTADMLRKEFPEIKISFNFTITPRNYRDIWPAYRFVTEMGLWFGAQMVVNHEGIRVPRTFSWKQDQIKGIGAQIERIIADICKREGALERLLKRQEKESLWLWTRLLYWWYLKKYSQKPERFFKGCMAGQRYAMLTPEGNLFFCPVNKHRIIGNVTERPFDEIWTSPKAQVERKYVNSCCCHCWLICTANPMLDLLVENGINGNA